jgi:hypothetical protein
MVETVFKHNWVRSTLGHGDTMCSKCKITNREAAVLGKLNMCEVPDAEAKDERDGDGTTPRVQCSRVIREDCEVTINADQLLDMLRTVYNLQIPGGSKTKVFVHVPGGGDWSNTDLDIDGDSPITIRWSQTTESI